MKDLHKIENKTKSKRQFHDTHSGEWVVVEPKKSVLSTAPPQDGVVWKVTPEERKEKKEKKDKKHKKEELSSSEEI